MRLNRMICIAPKSEVISEQAYGSRESARLNIPFRF